MYYYLNNEHSKGPPYQLDLSFMRFWVLYCSFGTFGRCREADDLRVVMGWVGFQKRQTRVESLSIEKSKSIIGPSVKVNLRVLMKSFPILDQA